MSMGKPRWRSDIAEHSRCHPGRPWPKGLGQVGPSDTRRQSAKSRGDRRLGSSSRASSCEARMRRIFRSEERRVGKEGSCRRAVYDWDEKRENARSKWNSVENQFKEQE